MSDLSGGCVPGIIDSSSMSDGEEMKLHATSQQITQLCYEMLPSQVVNNGTASDPAIRLSNRNSDPDIRTKTHIMFSDEVVTSSSSLQSESQKPVTVASPLVRPKKSFLELLQMAGASGEVFTHAEIIYHLKEYIGSRKMYDPCDPGVVYCNNNKLGEVFQVDKFTICDVLGLLSKNVTVLPYARIKKTRQVVPLPDQKQMGEIHMPGFSRTASTTTNIEMRHDSSPVITSTDSVIVSYSANSRKCKTNSETAASSALDSADSDNPLTTSKRKFSQSSADVSSGSNCEALPRKKQKTSSVSITYSDAESRAHPWHVELKMENSDENEVFSIHGPDPVDAFSVEYEIQSDSPSNKISDTDEENSGVSEKDAFILCNDSDVQFWADSSESESDTDTELSEADKWHCTKCDTTNSPVQRFCDKCWQLRPDWLPETRQSSPQAACKLTENSSEAKLDGNARVVTAISREDSGISMDGKSEEKLKEWDSATEQTENVNPDGETLEVRNTFSNICNFVEKAVDTRWSPPDHPVICSNKFSSSHKSSVPSAGNSGLGMCMICFSEPKNASLIHGFSGHQICCFKCGRMLKHRDKLCPVCRRPIQKVVKNYVM